MKSMKKIVFVSSGWLFNDPRYFYFIKSYLKRGYRVTAVNLIFNTKRFNATKLPQRWQDLQNQSLEKSFQYKVININFLKNTYFWTIFQRFFSLHLVLYYYRASYLFKELAELIKSADLIHGAEFCYGSVLSCHIAQKYQKPFVFDVKEYNFDLSHRKSYTRFARFIEKRLINNASVMPCVSPGIMSQYQKEYPEDKNKFTFLPNAVSLHETLNTIQPKSGKIKCILSCSFLPELKGIERFIELWERITPAEACLDLRLFGLNSKQKNKLIKLAEKTYNISLFIIPPVTEEELVISLYDYDIGIIPYLPDSGFNYQESCPNKFGQYVSAGLGIISTNLNYVSAEVTKNNLGAIYNPNDLETARQNIAQYFSNKLYVYQTGKNSLDYFQHIFNFEYYSKDYFEKLTKL
ncbi:MAG: glycosyltransferase [Gammaproteobacteria bacterium]|nr:glycosyltransferase [Gammaproteobacteria bacterium]